MKSIRIRSFSGPYFPAFDLNTEIYSVSNTDTFHIVIASTQLCIHVMLLGVYLVELTLSRLGHFDVSKTGMRANRHTIFQTLVSPEPSYKLSCTGIGF